MVSDVVPNKCVVTVLAGALIFSGAMLAKDATFYVGEGRFPRETHCSKGFFDQICQAPGWTAGLVNRTGRSYFIFRSSS